MIEIPGIKFEHEVIDMQDSTDQSHSVAFSDEHGNQVVINFCFGKITEVWNKKK